MKIIESNEGEFFNLFDIFEFYIIEDYSGLLFIKAQSKVIVKDAYKEYNLSEPFDPQKGWNKIKVKRLFQFNILSFISQYDVILQDNLDELRCQYSKLHDLDIYHTPERRLICKKVDGKIIKE